MLERDPASGGAYVLPTTLLSRHNLFCKTLCFPGNLFSLVKVEFCPLGCICIFLETSSPIYWFFTKKLWSYWQNSQRSTSWYAFLWENIWKLNKTIIQTRWQQDMISPEICLNLAPISKTHSLCKTLDEPTSGKDLNRVRNSSSILSSSPPTLLCKYFGYSGSELTCWLSLRTCV